MNHCIDYVSDMSECLEKNNNAEQELVQLQSFVDSVAKVHPLVTKYIIKM